MQDQVRTLTLLGLKAAFVGTEQEPAILQDIKEGKFMFVFISPESTVESERWRSVIGNSIYQINLIGVAIDEVQKESFFISCVVFPTKRD